MPEKRVPCPGFCVHMPGFCVHAPGNCVHAPVFRGSTPVNNLIFLEKSRSESRELGNQTESAARDAAGTEMWA